MKIINPDLLAEFRAAYRCEWCHEPTPQGCDPHHVYSRGAGRLDIRPNLISLGRLCCHERVRSKTRPTLLAIVATRERTTPKAITKLVHRLRRLHKYETSERDRLLRRYR